MAILQPTGGWGDNFARATPDVKHIDFKKYNVGAPRTFERQKEPIPKLLSIHPQPTLDKTIVPLKGNSVGVESAVVKTKKLRLPTQYNKGTLAPTQLRQGEPIGISWTKKTAGRLASTTVATPKRGDEVIDPYLRYAMGLQNSPSFSPEERYRWQMISSALNSLRDLENIRPLNIMEMNYRDQLIQQVREQIRLTPLINVNTPMPTSQANIDLMNMLNRELIITANTIASRLDEGKVVPSARPVLNTVVSAIRQGTVSTLWKTLRMGGQLTGAVVLGSTMGVSGAVAGSLTRGAINATGDAIGMIGTAGIDVVPSVARLAGRTAVGTARGIGETLLEGSLATGRALGGVGSLAYQGARLASKPLGLIGRAGNITRAVDDTVALAGRATLGALGTIGRAGSVSRGISDDDSVLAGRAVSRAGRAGMAVAGGTANMARATPGALANVMRKTRRVGSSVLQGINRASISPVLLVHVAEGEEKKREAELDPEEDIPEPYNEPIDEEGAEVKLDGNGDIEYNPLDPFENMEGNEPERNNEDDYDLLYSYSGDPEDETTDDMVDIYNRKPGEGEFLLGTDGDEIYEGGSGEPIRHVDIYKPVDVVKDIKRVPTLAIIASAIRGDGQSLRQLVGRVSAISDYLSSFSQGGQITSELPVMRLKEENLMRALGRIDLTPETRLRSRGATSSRGALESLTSGEPEIGAEPIPESGKVPAEEIIPEGEFPLEEAPIEKKETPFEQYNRTHFGNTVMTPAERGTVLRSVYETKNKDILNLLNAIESDDYVLTRSNIPTDSAGRTLPYVSKAIEDIFMMLNGERPMSAEVKHGSGVIQSKFLVFNPETRKTEQWRQTMNKIRDGSGNLDVLNMRFIRGNDPAVYENM